METSTQLSRLMTMLAGREPESETRSQQIMLSIVAMFAALALASIWGVAAGSSAGPLALANAVKLPMVVLLSALTALPAGLVALRLTNARLGALELTLAFASAIFGGTLVLAALAPLVAIYYHTSAEAGEPLALATVFIALATASLVFGRAVARRVGGKPGRAASLMSVGVLVVLFSAGLLQFVALASPFLAGKTVFDGGFDTVFGR